MFSPCPFVDWLVGLSARLHKSTQRISTKLRWRLGPGPEWTLLTFGVSAGIFSHFLLQNCFGGGISSVECHSRYIC